jgi:glutathione reductase (NADPH)
MCTDKFDVIVLGGGNAGIAVTGPTRTAGMSVAIVENRDFGGTCPNRGCTPKKVLVAAGHALHEIERASSHCISVAKPDLDWSGLIGREKRLIRDIPDRLQAMLVHRGVELIRGEGVFVGPKACASAIACLRQITSSSQPARQPVP